MSTPPTTTRRKNGRPSKFTAETVERILRCVERGMPLRLAANAADISFQSLVTYRNKSPKFADALLAAVAKGVEKRLKKIEDASDAGDWRAAAWLLEHCQPEHFAKNRIEVTGADGAPLAGAISIFLPRKDDAQPAVSIETRKAIEA